MYWALRNIFFKERKFIQTFSFVIIFEVMNFLGCEFIFH
jgi:hypothetical protein